MAGDSVRDERRIREGKGIKTINENEYQSRGIERL